jgi:excisionase family DNA binding protein
MTTAPELPALLVQLAQTLAEQQATEPPSVPEPRPMPPRVLLKVEEAAEQLGIGRTLAWRLVSTGELESVRIGRLRRVPTSAIQDFLAQLIAHPSGRDIA